MPTNAAGSEFQGKTVLITGASRGIGLSIARQFASHGATVVAAAKHGSDDLNALAAETRTTFVSVDMTDPDVGETLAAAAGPVDVLVNNVGLAVARPDGFLSITDDQWMASLTLNFLAAMRTTRAVLPSMLERTGASIVNIVSVNAELPDPAVIDYSAAKAGLANFSKSLSKEFGSRVRVNWVNPGPVSTDLWLGKGEIADTFSAASGNRPEDVAEGAVSTSDTKRFSHPDEVAQLVFFLAGANAQNITGAGFRIDGGLVSTI